MENELEVLLVERVKRRCSDISVTQDTAEYDYQLSINRVLNLGVLIFVLLGDQEIGHVGDVMV